MSITLQIQGCALFTFERITCTNRWVTWFNSFTIVTSSWRCEMRSLDKLIKCAKREVAIWRNAYPKFVARGTMSKTQCMEEIDCMEDIIALLERQKLLEEVSNEFEG